MEFSDMVFRGYIQGLDDWQMLTRPGPGCNHLAWQCGHLIATESWLLESMLPGTSNPLPLGFAEAHSKATSGCDSPAAFRSKGEYLHLMESTRAATLAAFDSLSDDALDQSAPEFVREFCPTIGHLFILIGTHPMMHAGQAVPLRRQLNKPYVFF